MGTILFAGTVDMSCWRISILQQSEAIPSISAAYVRTTTTFHLPRRMLATGLHGEIARASLAEIHTTAAWGPVLMRNEAPAGGMPGLLRFATRVRGDIANPTYGIKPFIIKQPERSAMPPIGLILSPTGGIWQTLSRGDREEARPITGGSGHGADSQPVRGRIRRDLRPLFRGRRDARKSRVSATVSF